MDKAHVEHAVSFVEHEDFKPVELNKTLVHEVEQAAGCGRQDVDAFAQGIGLRCLAHATKNYLVAKGEVSPVGTKTLIYLDGELARWGKNKRPYGPGVYRSFPARKQLQHRNGKGRGLAGSCLGHAQEVSARKYHRNRLRLNRRRLLIALL